MSQSLSATHAAVAIAIRQLCPNGPRRVTTAQLVAAAGVSRRSAQYGVRHLLELGAVVRYGEYDRLLATVPGHALWAELEGATA